MIGRDLRTIREACGVTVGDLAYALGWPVSLLHNVERVQRHALDVEAVVVLSALARIIRERTPVVVIDAPPSRAQ